MHGSSGGPATRDAPYRAYLSVLRCPRCRSTLSDSPAGLACSGPACAYGTDPFPIVGACPALIDFDDSVIARSALVASTGGSAIERREGLANRVRELVIGVNTVAKANGERFVAELKQLSPRPRLLVIGGGKRGAGTEAFYDRADIELIVTDVYASPDVGLIVDGHALPFADGSVDGVWVQAVLEHVLEPQRVVAEIHRVLAPRGLVYAETPFMQQVHEGPYDFTRFSRSGHRWLFRRFEEIAAGEVGGPGASLIWSWRYLVRALTRSNKAATLAALPVFWLRFLDGAADRRFAADAANGVYFLGRRSEATLSAKEIVTYYPGPR